MITITATVLQTPTTIEGTIVHDDPEGTMTTQPFNIAMPSRAEFDVVITALIDPVVTFYQFVLGRQDRNLHGWNLVFESENNPVRVFEFDFDSLTDAPAPGRGGV